MYPTIRRDSRAVLRDCTSSYKISTTTRKGNVDTAATQTRKTTASFSVLKVLQKSLHRERRFHSWRNKAVIDTCAGRNCLVKSAIPPGSDDAVSLLVCYYAYIKMNQNRRVFILTVLVIISLCAEICILRGSISQLSISLRLDFSVISLA